MVMTISIAWNEYVEWEFAGRCGWKNERKWKSIQTSASQPFSHSFIWCSIITLLLSSILKAIIPSSNCNFRYQNPSLGIRIRVARRRGYSPHPLYQQQFLSPYTFIFLFNFYSTFFLLFSCIQCSIHSVSCRNQNT